MSELTRQQTGEYIGVLESERKIWDKEQGKDIVIYKVQAKDGNVVEFLQDKFTLNEP